MLGICRAQQAFFLRFFHLALVVLLFNNNAFRHPSQDFLATFEASRGERKRLREREEELNRVVAADDIRLLRERLLLMERQWDELQHQLQVKERVIDGAMSEWSAFLAKYRDFSDWLTDIEERVVATKEYHIEDIIDKLQNVS